jgi:hypothetical protein
MGQYRIILNSFGLQHIKPLFYGVGKPLEVGAGDYNSPALVYDYFPRFDTGSTDTQRMSVLGTPIFSDMILQYRETKLVLDLVLLEVTQKKTIVSTSIVGRDGSVKEFINNADYSINIKGSLFSNMPNVVPEEELKKLKEIVAINDTIRVISPFLDLFDVRNIVVSMSKINQLEGKSNIINFDITCESDLELSILVNE